MTQPPEKRLLTEAAGAALLAAGVPMVWTQTASAGTWTITHDRGRIPTVAIYLTTGEEVHADVTANTTQVTITFASPTAGVAVLT